MSVSIVRHYYELVDGRDVDGLVALFHPDATYRRPGYDPLVGRAAIERFYREERVIVSGAHRLRSIVTGGDDVAVEGSFTGELRDGRSVTLDFADFFTVQSDLIVVRTTYFFVAAV